MGLFICRYCPSCKHLERLPRFTTYTKYNEYTCINCGKIIERYWNPFTFNYEAIVKNPLWLIQSNLINKEENKRLIASLKKYNCDYKLVKIIPFQGLEKNPPYLQNIIVYGSTSMINEAIKLGIKPLYYNPSINYRTYLKRYEGMMLNSDCLIVKLGEIFNGFLSNYVPFKGNNNYFLRPIDDSKLFCGGIFNKEESSKLIDTLLNDRNCSIDKEIVVSIPKNIEAEWRLFVIGGDIVTGSRYRINGKLNTSTDIPKEVISFANKVIKKYNPYFAYTLDIGLYKDEYKVIELGCFNSSGFYLSSTDKIIEAFKKEFR